jgi:cyanobactin oxidase ThcOx-like protein
LRAPRKDRRQTAGPIISARLSSHITLGAQVDGSLVASFGGYSIGLGKFSAGVMVRAQNLRRGLPLGSFMSDGPTADEEIDRLVRRLARHGLLEYGLGLSPDADDQVVIEPQVPDYWPRAPELGDAETIVLSRFAYLRRRGDGMVLESPRAGALFRICDPKIAGALSLLAKPQQISQFRQQEGFPGYELLGLLVDCQILFRIEGGEGLRADEGDTSLVLWDFHDLLFHTRSTEGRQANPLGGLYAHAGVIDPPPAVRQHWPGKAIELGKFLNEPAENSAVAKLLRERHSTREFDEQQPITLAELSRFLDRSARIQSKWKSRLDEFSDDSPDIEYAARPYPSAGSAYELEL